MSQIRRILFIELLGGIGDVIIALPAIHALARSHAAAELTVLTFAPGSQLLHSDPLIDRVLEAHPGEARQSVDQLLACETFDLIVSDTRYDGIAVAIQTSGTPFCVTNLWRSPPDDERVSDRFLKLLLADGWIHSEVIGEGKPSLHLMRAERAIARRALGAAYRPLIFLYPDAGMSIKRWSTENFIALGQSLQQQYGATIVIPVGSDGTQAEQLVGAIGGTARLWQRGSLRELAAAMAEADLVVAADTGSARIAAALNVPTITLFGPSWSGRYGQQPPHMNLQGFPNCPERKVSNFTEQRCWYSGHCPFEWQTCLEDITPDRVLEAATKLLKGRRDRVAISSVKAVQSSVFLNETPGYPPAIESLQPLSIPYSAELPSWQSVRNLLVMRLDNIGDVMMTSPALRALRANLPQAKITLMASPSGSLVAPLLADVDEVLPWRVLWQDLGRLAFDPDREWELVKTLKSRQFDAAIIFTSFSQSPHPPALLCALAGIPLRLGESKEQDLGTLTHAVPPAPDHIHQVDRNLRLLEWVGFQVVDRRLTLTIPEAARLTVHQRLTQISPSHSTDLAYLVLNPWTSCQSRNYDPLRFATAARQLSDLTGWSVVVTGVEKDRDRSHSLMEILGDRGIDWIGQTNLAELVALIANAKLVLTNNTSTMHIADATSTPNVVLFAGTEQECQWQPRHSPSRILRRLTICSPCYAFKCAYDLQCLDISPGVVVATGLDLLGIGANMVEETQCSTVWNAHNHNKKVRRDGF